MVRTPSDISSVTLPDHEKGAVPDHEKGYDYTSDEGYVPGAKAGDIDSSSSFLKRFAYGFKPVPIPDPGAGLTRQERAIRNTTAIPLQRKLRNRHIQMIAIGGSIGAGLFVSSGNSMQAGGPGGMVIGYFLVGILLFVTMVALGELGVRYPVNGVFSAYNSRFVDYSWGFSVGWIYALAWLLSLPTELNAAAVTIGFWKGDDNGATNVNPAAWVALFYGVIVFINVFGVRGYGEAEVFFSSIKVAAVVGFIIFGIVIAAGGGPHHEYIGGRYWHNPGAFANGAKGVFQVFVSASYAFTGTEFAGLAAAETDKPHRALPRAVRQIFFRIILFYLVSIIVMGCLVPYTDKHLGVASDGSASPFVIAIERAGVSGLPSVMNTVIILAVISVGNSAVYGSTRTVVSLAAQGHAPKFFLYIDRKGRPIAALGLSLGLGLLGFLAASKHRGDAFNWMSNTGGYGGLLTWMSICGCHIRNRLAMKAKGVGLDELEYKAPTGIWGSVVGIVLGFLILGLNVWVSLFPLHTKKASVKGFFEVWLSFVIIVVLFIGHKLWFRDGIVAIKDIDVTTGVRASSREEILQEIADEKAFMAAKPWYYRWWRYWC